MNPTTCTMVRARRHPSPATSSSSRANTCWSTAACSRVPETAADGRSAADRLEIDFPLEGVGALVLTHVHIDHCGRLPWLLAAGFKGPILCSEPSARLLPTVLADAFAVGVSRDRALIERYLGKVEPRIRALPYGKWHLVYRSPDASCRIRLQRAGHILGSAYVECELSGAAWPEPRRVVFSAIWARRTRRCCRRRVPALAGRRAGAGDHLR